MDTEEINPLANQVDESDQTSIESIEPTSPSSPRLKRRRFLAAAALGTAAAALLNKGSRGGLRLGPATALADDLSTFQCTAGDVEIIGTAQVINEPCSCSGTFNAQVQFTVRNNAASDRGCITLHLVAATLPDNTVIPPMDILLQGTIAGKTTQVMTGTINNYPCGAGLVCFGSPTADGRRRCDPGQCSTVSWTVPGQDTCPPDRQISSKCRHQQICIQGRGRTTISCPNDDCSVECGGSTTLTVCTTEPASEGPFVFELRSGNSLVERFPASGTTTDTCHDFTVSPTANTTYFGRVISTQDDPDCVKDSGPVTVTVESITVTLAVSGGDACNSGNLTFTASTGRTGCTYNFSVDGTSVQNTTSNTYNYPADPDGQCHRVSVVATCGSCVSNTDSKRVSQCVRTTIDC